MFLTVWALSFLSFFAVILGVGVRQRLMSVQRLDERDRLRYISEAGVKRAIVELRKEGERIYDSFQDSCGNNLAAFKDVAVGEGRFNISYYLTDELSGVRMLRYGLVDENRKINVNTADATTLERLFKIVTDMGEMAAQELAASIVDWRDEDSELSLPSGSAEDSYYRGLSYSYEAKDAGFEVMDELLLVKGVDSNLFAKMKEYVTIYGDGRVNINTASKAVLSALGLGESAIDKIISFRYGKDGALDTEDDNVFEATSSIVPKLSQFSSLSDSELAQLTTVADRFLTVKSDNFTIKGAANLRNRENFSSVECAVNRWGRILYWRET